MCTDVSSDLEARKPNGVKVSMLTGNCSYYSLYCVTSRYYYVVLLFDCPTVRPDCCIFYHWYNSYLRDRNRAAIRTYDQNPNPYSERENSITTFAVNLPSWTADWCFFKLPNSAKSFPQISQENGFSPSKNGNLQTIRNQREI